MVRVQRVMWPRGAAEAAPVQAELWEPFHHGPPAALCPPHPTRVHTGVSARPLLPLGGRLRLEHGRFNSTGVLPGDVSADGSVVRRGRAMRLTV